MSEETLKYALCIESIFPGLEYSQRIERTLESGYNAVEVWSVDDDKRKVLAEAKTRGVRTAMLVGARGFAVADKNHHRAELESLRRNLEIARELNCPNICLFVGDRDPNLIYDQSRAAVLDFLGEAAEVLQGSGATGIVESLSPAHHPQGFAVSMRDVIAWIRELNRPEIRLQFDVYHTAMTDPDVEKLVRENVEYTAYYQAADAPGRAQPGTGTLNFTRILGDIKSAGFDGYFCWEFAPQGDAMQAIAQAKKVQI
jgi:hydroxypyruvate isomerase